MKIRQVALIILLSCTITVSVNGVNITSDYCDTVYTDCKNDVNKAFDQIQKDNSKARLKYLDQCGEKYTKCKENREKLTTKTWGNYIVDIGKAIGSIATAGAAVAVAYFGICTAYRKYREAFPAAALNAGVVAANAPLLALQG